MNIINITNQKAYYKCLCKDSDFFINNKKIIRLSQTQNLTKIQTLDNTIIYNNETKDTIISKEYYKDNGFNINDFNFLDNLKNDTKFIIKITPEGFEFKYDIEDNTTENNYEIEKQSFNKNIDLDFDKTFLKDIISNIINKTIEISNQNETINKKVEENTNLGKIIIDEIEKRHKLNLEENIYFFEIQKHKFDNLNKIQKQIMEKENDIKIKKYLMSIVKPKCNCNYIENIIEQYNNEIIFEIEKEYNSISNFIF